MSKFFCKHCGNSAPSVSSLTGSTCVRQLTRGAKHVLYEGSEKSRYTCKHCGNSANSISSLTGSTCLRHPDGRGNHHEPAL